MSSYRRPVYFNSSPRPLPFTDADAANIKLASHFHQQLPGYAPTPLTPLEPIAKKIGVKAVYLKDESDRLGLPSFKILGASWGTFRAVTQRLGLSYSEVTIEAVKKELKSRPVTLFAATDGNHGRAIARMGSVLGVPVEIHVPAGMAAHTIELIQAEGAFVIESEGTYDAAMREAQGVAAKKDGILIQDCAFDSYREIPQVSFSHGIYLLCSSTEADFGSG
jgi:diaminopropionate ammonia-lyase family